MCGAPGPHAHGNAARQVLDDRRAEVRGQQKPSNDPPQQPAQPPVRQLLGTANAQTAPAATSTAPVHERLGSANAKQHQREHGPQRPTKRSDPAQHAKGTAGDCPGPRKETGTRRNVTQGRGGAAEGNQPSPLGCIADPHVLCLLRRMWSSDCAYVGRWIGRWFPCKHAVALPRAGEADAAAAGAWLRPGPPRIIAPHGTRFGRKKELRCLPRPLLVGFAGRQRGGGGVCGLGPARAADQQLHQNPKTVGNSGLRPPV